MSSGEENANNNSSINSNNTSSSSNNSNRRKEELIRELWNARQMLYRLYDLEGMSEWRARDLIVLHELFEEYDLVSILSSNEDRDRDRWDSILQDLHAIRDKIDSRMREASRKGETRRKGYLAKQLDKILTLIALAEKQEREGLNRLVSMYHLLNRNNKQLLEALKVYLNDDKKNESEDTLSEVIQSIKHDLEREIIELKKRLQ